uniref:Endo/exonuclease/phosphatase domain-containing protein n=1 Tax=Caenorhabditis japonica TaxID=281687 RepID=A0A8R1EAX2_CAEJA
MKRHTVPRTDGKATTSTSALSTSDRHPINSRPCIILAIVLSIDLRHENASLHSPFCLRLFNYHYVDLLFGFTKIDSNVLWKRRESHRITTATFEFHGSHLHVINVYAPTSAANESQSDKFYKDLKKVYTRLSKWDSSIIICGDFNAVEGWSLDDIPFVGGHGTGQRSENGDRLVDFAFSSRVSILNTIYPKRPNRKWAWISPDGKTKNEIDFILTNQKKQKLKDRNCV